MNYIEASLRFIGSMIGAAAFTIVLGIVACAWCRLFSFGWNLLL